MMAMPASYVETLPGQGFKTLSADSRMDKKSSIFFFVLVMAQKGKKAKGYILLLDIRMPKVDGIEVLRRVKSSSDLNTLPVIMITTTKDPAEIKRCHDYGCNLYMSKPVQYDAFSQAIERLGLFLSEVKVPSI